MTVETLKPMIDAIDKSDHTIATKKITKFELKVPVQSFENFRHFLNVFKIKSEDETKQKMEESEPTWSDYLAKLKADGTSSKEFLLASLCKELRLSIKNCKDIAKRIGRELQCREKMH
jgi:hypothetical protein